MAVRTPAWRSVTLAAALSLVLTLSGCGDDPETLSHVAVDRTVVDAETSQTTTVHGYVPDIVPPVGFSPERPLEDPVILAVDVTVTVGPDRSFSVRPGDFELRTSAGEVTAALASVDRTLQDESLWPLTETRAGTTQRGWVAFAVERDEAADATLVAHRPDAMTVDGRGSLPAASLDVPLSPAG